MRPTRTIERHMTFQLIAPSRPHPYEIRATLIFRSTNPHAVQANFHDGSGTIWMLSRDLLLDGLSRATGEGDVTVQPFPFQREPGQDPEKILISMSTPEGAAKLAVHAGGLATFLARTCEIVPVGTEGEQYDIDAEWRAFCESAG